jgi:peptidoglycan hydrolase-like protein with peptidoglycan-binding domain
MTRRVLVIATAVAVAGAALGTAAMTSVRGSRGHSARAAVPIANVTVVRTNLSTTTQMSGTLGYSGSYTLTANGLPGTVTALPEVGQVITRGQSVFEIDGQPVYLFYGQRPSWRLLGPGVIPGPDVQQLEQNLTALGYANPENLTIDDTFTWATDLAVRRWQSGSGQTATGILPVGRVVYAPGPIQVTTIAAVLGSLASPNEAIVRATSTVPLVTVAVPAAQTYLVNAGDPVTVTLPSGITTPGRVESISAIATSDQSQTGAGAPTTSGTSGSAANSGGGPSQETVPAYVSLSAPAAAAHLDQAPVTINITDRAVSGVLAVPVTALVAAAGGGYGVWLRSQGTRRLVAVTPGLFSTSLVQITAAGLAPGDIVEVPSP